MRTIDLAEAKKRQLESVIPVRHLTPEESKSWELMEAESNKDSNPTILSYEESVKFIKGVQNGTIKV